MNGWTYQVDKFDKPSTLHETTYQFMRAYHLTLTTMCYMFLSYVCCMRLHAYVDLLFVYDLCRYVIMWLRVVIVIEIVG